MYMDLNNDHLKKTDRVLKLRPIDGTKPLSSTGVTDPRLFSGENALHAVMDEGTTLWCFKYEKGVLPPALKDQKFTTFAKLIDHANTYYKGRNVEIYEVKD